MRTLSLAFAMLILFGCGKKSSTDDDGGGNFTYTDSPTAAQESALLGLENAAASSEGSTSTSFTGVPSKHGLMSVHPKTDCATLDFSTCSGGATSMSFGNCTETDSGGDAFTFFRQHQRRVLGHVRRRRRQHGVHVSCP